MASALWGMAKRFTQTKPRFDNEASRLRKAARDGDVAFSYSKHALDEMAKDDIYRIDVENVIRKCVVTLVETGRRGEEWRAQGSDTEGRGINAVVVLYEEEKRIRVITVWGVKGRR